MTITIEEELKEIKKRLDALTILSKNILALLVKEEKPLPDEVAAIEKEEEIVDENAIFGVLKD